MKRFLKRVLAKLYLTRLKQSYKGYDNTEFSSTQKTRISDAFAPCKKSFARSFILFIGTVSLLSAHPHVFIDTRISVEQEKIWILWTFDEMSSSILMQDYDKNRDKILDEKEIAFLKKDHFDTIANYSFFMHPFDGKEEKTITQVDDFMASFEDSKLRYLFSIPRPKIPKYELRFYDGEMYVAMIVKPEFLTCQKPFTCQTRGYDADFYYGYQVIIRQ